MPDFRRAHARGGTFFFTIVTENRAPILCTDRTRQILRTSIEECIAVRPFKNDAMVLIEDHIHAIWTLPPGDNDYSRRWAAIKARFTSLWLQSGGEEQRRTGSRVHERRRGVWQRRFWEHQIRDEDDWRLHMDYIHYNPVKHGLVSCPHAWPYSTFRKWVASAGYEREWQCCCDGRAAVPLKFDGLDELAME